MRFLEETNGFQMMLQRQPMATAGKTQWVNANPGMLRRRCACGQYTSGRECAECGKERTPRATAGGTILQRHSTGNQDSAKVPEIVYDVLRSSGQPLDIKTRAFFEPRLSRDFSPLGVGPRTRSTLPGGVEISAPGDVSEQEAARFARGLVTRPDPTNRDPELGSSHCDLSRSR